MMKRLSVCFFLPEDLQNFVYENSLTSHLLNAPSDSNSRNYFTPLPRRVAYSQTRIRHRELLLLKILVARPADVNLH